MQTNNPHTGREPQGGDSPWTNLAFVVVLFTVFYILLRIAAAVEGGGL